MTALPYHRKHPPSSLNTWKNSHSGKYLLACRKSEEKMIIPKIAFSTLPGRVGSLPASYSWGPMFKSRAIYRLIWLKFTSVCRSLSNKFTIDTRIRLCSLYFTFFLINHSFTVNPHYIMQYILSIVK